ncbi:nuclear pore complex protein Nup153-like, partial [Gigantopelta aegis]|uniref:nuclear pore complex protein Nup153-like n=1 Tax=Gigantopelta aegis TaxID=1735272 RepID=UPI001B88BAAF
FCLFTVHNCRYDTVDLKCPVCQTSKRRRCVSKYTSSKECSYTGQCTVDPNKPQHTETVLTIIINGKDQQSLLDKFKLKPENWECSGCYCRNEADVLKCPACQTLKPGVKQDEVSAQTGKISTGGFQFGTAGGFTFGTKTTQPKETKAAPVAEGKEISFADKFKPKPGSWECSGCCISNDANILQCSVCQTLKWGIKKEDIEQKSQSQTEAILGEGCLQFGRAGGFTFRVNKPQSKDQPTDSLFKANKPETMTADSKGPLSSGGFTFQVNKPQSKDKPADSLFKANKPETTSDSEGPLSSGGFTFQVNKVQSREQPADSLFKANKPETTTADSKGPLSSGEFTFRVNKPQSKDHPADSLFKANTLETTTADSKGPLSSGEFTFRVNKPESKDQPADFLFKANKPGTTTADSKGPLSSGEFTFQVNKPQSKDQPADSLFKANKPETTTVDSKGPLSSGGFCFGIQPKLVETKPEPLPKGYSCASAVLAHQKLSSASVKFSFALATKTGGFNVGSVGVSAWEPSRGFSSMPENTQSKDTVVTIGIKDKYQQFGTSGGFSFAVKITQPKETKVSTAAAANKIFYFADKFKPDTESWTCTCCYCRNDANVLQCAACQTLKPRTEKNIQQKSQSQSGTILGGGLQSGITGRFTFDVQPTDFLFQINKPETKTVDSKGPPSLGGFTSGTKATQVTKIKTAPIADGNQISFADKFQPKPGSWECTGCYYKHDANVLQCSACRILKPGTKEDDIWQKSQSQSGTVLGVSGLQFGSAERSTFGVSKPQLNVYPTNSLFKTQTGVSKGPL